MDKQTLLQEIQLLDIAYAVAQKKPKIEILNPAEYSVVNQAYLIYQEYYNKLALVRDIKDFTYYLGTSSSLYSETKKALLTQNGESENAQPTETSSIPSTLEAMVAAYEQNQVERANLEDRNSHPIAEAIKRARATQAIFQKAKWREERTKQSDIDKAFSQYIEPKNDRNYIEKDIRFVAERIVDSQLSRFKLSRTNEVNQVVEELIFSIESGAVNIDNYRELDIASRILLRDHYENSNFEINEVDDRVKEQLISEETEEEYSDQKVNQAAQKVNETSDKFKSFRGDLLGSQLENIDDRISQAKSKIESIQQNLQKVFPNATITFSKLNFQEKRLQEFEKLVTNSDLLNRQTSSGASRIVGTISQTGGNIISPTVVKLIGRGLDEKKLDTLFKENKDLEKYRNLVYSQFKKVYKSKLLDDIQKGVHNSKLAPILNPKATLENFVNKKIGEQAGKTILRYTSNATAKRLGNFLLEHGLQEGAKRFASEVGKKLLIAGAKQAGVGAAKAAGMATADSVIASAAVALGVPTAGLSLVIGAVLVALQIGWEVVKYGYTKLKRSLGITEEDDKENKKAFWLGLGALATTGFAIRRGARGFAIATKAAIISAVGIIILSLATIAVFLTLTFLTAPLLSTFVQLDSMEKVKYGKLAEPPTPVNCANMLWPFAGKFQITQGPRVPACTHKNGITESVDFGTPNGTDILSISDGTVESVGDDGPDKGYGKYVKISATTDKGQKFIIIYGHLMEQSVGVGDSVKAGQKIGVSDNNGYSTGPHLHLGYLGENGQPSPVEYNSCPAGGFKVNENCCDTSTCNQP